MDIFSYALTNALLAGLLGLVIVVMVRPHKYPRAARVLWLLVLVKLLLPPLVPLSLPAGWRMESADSPVGPSRSAADIPISSRSHALRGNVDAGRSAAGPTTRRTASANVVPTQSVGTREGRDGPIRETHHARVIHQSTAGQASSGTRASFDAHRFALAIWFAGSALWLSVVATRVIRFERWLQRAGSSPTPVPRGRLTAMIEEAAARLQLRRLPRVVVVPGKVPPLVWPIGRGGKVIVPAELVDTLSPSELRLVLAHELAHLKRRDHWVRWFEAAVTGLYWWHPVVWLARRELRTAEEIGCDQLVLRVFSPAASQTYGEALIKTSDFVTTCSRASYAMASGFVRPSPLKRRIEMIVRPATTNSRTRRVATLAAFAAALALLPLSIDFAPGQEPAQEVVLDAQLPATIDFAPGQEPAGEVDEVVRPGDDAGTATRAEDLRSPTERLRARYENAPTLYADAKTLGDALEIFRDQLRDNGMEEYALLLQEERVLNVIRTEIDRYERVQEARLAEAPDDQLAKTRLSHFRRRVKPILERILSDGSWPENCYFWWGKWLLNDGVNLSLHLSTPRTPPQLRFALPILEVRYGRAAGGTGRDERPRRAADSPSVRRLQSQIDALSLKEATAVAEQLGTEEAMADKDADATAASLDEVIRRSENSAPATVITDANNDARLRLMREYVEFMQEQLERAEALRRAGQPGGEAQSVASAGYQLAKARAEMFDVMGDREQARRARQEAVDYAQQAFEAAEAIYRVGRLSQDRLFQAREQLLKAKLEALSVPRPSETRKPPAATAVPR